MRKGTPLASRVAQGVSGPSSSCVWNPRVFADDLTPLPQPVQHPRQPEGSDLGLSPFLRPEKLTYEPLSSLSKRLGLATCEGDQVRQAEAVGQDDEFHVVQVGAGGEHASVQVLQHGPHAAFACLLEDEELLSSWGIHWSQAVPLLQGKSP